MKTQLVWVSHEQTDVVEYLGNNLLVTVPLLTMPFTFLGQYITFGTEESHVSSKVGFSLSKLISGLHSRFALTNHKMGIYQCFV